MSQVTFMCPALALRKITNSAVKLSPTKAPTLKNRPMPCDNGRHNACQEATMPRHRELQITLKPVQLTLCVALGLWLGAVAIALSLWLAVHLWPEQMQPVAQAVAPALAPARPAAPPTQPADAQSEMFERYKAILHKQELQQAAEAAQGTPRNLNSPKCQFWLSQNRTAPTDKSQANVLEFCY
jgi:hypothetical protein